MALDLATMRHGTTLLKRGFAKMQEGGVIMDVVTPEQAQVAEDAGATAVMALERVPADIRADGGVARMSHPQLIRGIIETTSIPVMAKARIGHSGEARVLEALGVDMIDESEVLTPADPFYHIPKDEFKPVPGQPLYDEKDYRNLYVHDIRSGRTTQIASSVFEMFRHRVTEDGCVYAAVQREMTDRRKSNLNYGVDVWRW